MIRDWFSRAVRGLAVLACVARTSAALPEIDFTAADRVPDGWKAGADVTGIEATPEGLRLTLGGPDPQLLSPVLDLPGSGLRQLKLRLRSETAGEFQVFFHRDHPREEQSVRFPVPAFRWVETAVPLPREVGGAGWRFRLDPPGTGGVCTLGRLRFEDVGTVGVTRVAAEGSELVLRIEGVTGVAEVVSLPAGSDLTEAHRGRVVHTADFSGPAEIRVARFAFEANQRVDRLYRGYVVRRPPSGPVPEPIGSVRFVESFRGMSRNDWPFPEPGSKKGLQVQMVDDAVALGVRHAALNVDLPALADLGRSADSYTWTLDGETYHFRRAAVDAIPVKALSDAGAAVYLILLAYEPANPELRRLFLHPGYDRRAPNRLGAFNTAMPEGIAWLRATMEFLADRFSRADSAHGRVAGYIVGNEVTAHWHWANLGEASSDRFIEAYLTAVRIVHAAVRTASANARVYLSFDHHWNLVYGGSPLRAIAGRPLLDAFQRRATAAGDFDWHLAYHPYPENLFEPRSWLDKTAEPRPETPRITFRNLDVLTAYLARPELLHDGRPRRVILSEQGFHSVPTAEGEAAQAAGYCYAWKQVGRLPGIDAFILHRHVDHRDEGGLNLGLWRRKADSVATPDTRKPVYEVFRAAGTPEEDGAFRFALPLIGIPDWSALGR